MQESTARPGRPRDPHADEAILAAARDLLAEGGLVNLTVEGTAQRAGVAKTTVYRRYPTKLILAVSAVAALITPMPESESVDGMIRTSLELFRGQIGSPTGQRAFLAVAAAAAGDPVVHQLFAEKVLAPLQASVTQALDEARARGDASLDASPEFVFDVLMGTIVHRAIIRQDPPDDDFRHKFTELTRYVYMGQPKAPGD